MLPPLAVNGPVVLLSRMPAVGLPPVVPAETLSSTMFRVVRLFAAEPAMLTAAAVAP
jgi:hypothetical protein